MINGELLDRFCSILGRRHVLTGQKAIERFCSGFRSGRGDALCVLRPGTLLEQWKVLQACNEAGKIVIMQAANTGLTEGSAPNCTYDRDVVLINTRRMDKLELLNGGQQVLCFPGATLFRPGNTARAPWPRIAFGNRIVLHRRIGHRRRLQLLRRLARGARTGLHRTVASSTSSARPR